MAKAPPQVKIAVASSEQLTRNPSRTSFVAFCGNYKLPKNAFGAQHKFSATDVVVFSKFIYMRCAVPEVRGQQHQRVMKSLWLQ